jgi:high-affinity iron transporter
MLSTFVIGLREGLEAALIVSIVAAFLKKNGRSDLLRWVFAGIGVAVLLCAAVGVSLRAVSQSLPQRQQEALETVIGVIAVVMVTYMVIWMRRHARELKGQLEGAASAALAAGSGMALVAMAFLAVLREGFETSVFLLAAFNESSSGTAAGFGALLGVGVAIALGYGIYRGGVRLDLSKFFRATGVLLVLVAAGLVATALHTAHEAGWINTGQQQFVDLTAAVRPGSIQSSLLTGMLGIQERPTVIESLGWLAYLLPVGLYVAWPAGRSLSQRARRRSAVGLLAAGLATATLCVLLAPASPATGGPTDFGVLTAQLVTGSPAGAVFSTALGTGDAVARRDPARRAATEIHGGLRTDRYELVEPAPVEGQPRTATLGQVSSLNGGRLPLGANTTDAVDAPITLADLVTVQLTWWVEPTTTRVVDVRVVTTRQTVADLSTGTTPIGAPAESVVQPDSASVSAAVESARSDGANRQNRGTALAFAIAAGVVALIGAGWLLALSRFRRAVETDEAPIALAAQR